MRRPARLVYLALLGSLGGCSEHGPRVITGRDVESARAAPRVSSVRDIGSPPMLGKGEVPTSSSDGVAVIGELLLIGGEEFGRRPRITIDGRPTTQLARTDQGVVVRVPWGVRSGRREVAVRNARGRGVKEYAFRRYALATVPSRDAIFPFTVTRKGIERAGDVLPLPGASRIRYSADGRIALVSGHDSNKGLIIATLDMIASPSPRLGKQFSVPGDELIALAAAERAPLAVALSNSHAVFLDTRNPERPALYHPLELPAELAGRATAADMSPEGDLLAVLVAETNELHLYDTSTPGKLLSIAKTRVLPKARAPLVRDIRFASDSKTVWVISGDNVASVRHGRFAPRLTVIKVQRREGSTKQSIGVLSVWRSLDVPHRAAPVDLTVARGQPLASGQTVAIPPQNAAVFITTHDSSLLRLRKTRFDRKRGLRRAARILRGIKLLGTVVRTDINGHGGPMYVSDSLLGAIEITSDSQLLLVAGAKVEVTRSPAAVRLVYGISTCSVFGEPTPVFTSLAKVDPEALARPFTLGDVRVQP